MTTNRKRRLLTCLLAGMPLGLAACATMGRSGAAPSPPTLDLGRNAIGDPCRADLTWRDGAVRGQFDRAYVVTCRNVTASRSVGTLRSVLDRPEAIAAIEATLDCGPARSVPLAGIGTAEARRCFDRTLGDEAVVISFRRGDRWMVASGIPAVLGPVEQGAVLLAGGQALPADGARTANLDPATLGPAPEGPAVASGPAGFNPAIALQQGIGLNLKGLHHEASRVLNDALSRLPADAPLPVRAELLLEAGLADSNIGFTAAARQHFRQASALLASAAGAEQAPLIRKRDIYAVLDLVNRRDYRAAVARLDRAPSLARSGDPLRDPAVVQSLNRSTLGTGSLSRAVTVVDAAIISQLLLQTQADWARSVAHLGLGDTARAATALERANASFRLVETAPVAQAPMLWLRARLDRQAGRIAIQARDWTGATQSFDRALTALETGSIGTGGTGNEPAIAELKLERAGITLRSGAAPAEVHAAYQDAIDALESSGVGGGAVSSGIERYLGFLLAQMDGPDRERNQERFFRAVQAAGEPAVAGQLNQLQTVLSAEPELGARMRDRADLERQLVALRYEIEAAQRAGDQTDRARTLTERREQVQRSLTQVQNALAANPRLGAVEGRPVEIAEIRGTLQPGEVYFKVTELGDSAYGMLIAREATLVYQIGATPDELRALAAPVRQSIDGRLRTEGVVPPFDVRGSFALFSLLAGPAAERLANARAVVVDPGGPLHSLPLGVLVTDRASSDSYWRNRRGRERDFSNVAFLARRTAVSIALSPRSFLIARQLPPSHASRSLAGFAQPAPPPPTGGATIDFGVGCRLDYRRYVQLWGRLAPIDAGEIGTVAQALGVADPLVVSGAQFTDYDLRRRSDLDQYKVLHFATHGFQEGEWGCDNSPPALLTSLAAVPQSAASAEDAPDGLLSFSEIARLRLDANLVVLSACDTGGGVRGELARRSGQEEAGATLEGLVRAFLAANSRAVMATHWPVSARQESVEIMRVFYETARDRPIGEALQTAQRRLMDNPRYSHPFYWGAYFVVGDAGKMMLGGSAG